MKTYDLGLVAGIVVLILALTSVFSHKHTKDCPLACSAIEDAAEASIDNILHIPSGTSEKIIDSLGS